MAEKIKRNKLKRISLTILYLFVFVLLFVYFTRAFSIREIDDVTPAIECDYNLIEKSDILWVIPIFQNKSIAEDKEWCSYILSLNKTLQMHGVYHTYREFGEIKDKEYIERGMIEFEKCFGYSPTMFKAPQMYMNSENLKIIKSTGLVNRGAISQVLHKVYHCSDTGKYSNKFIEWF